ncbi:Flp family type IVb pilin [Acinetobacter boissieri]|uniref:Pilus assembly protein Flp/PilA n=1 Tax=Acinetobacter boissieri TaxID=1219383 RepID=A0A1G6JU07_9GAMM|nr:hypothetical protein [Acinetobacter boissieri]SDC22232.1 hypothetical protein SAMN05421733_11271 [Acinetobacter boissieri]
MLNIGLKKNARGQGMTEYIIIVALIAVAAIGVFRYFGNTARAQVAVAAAELGGQDSKTARTGATSNGTKAVTEGTTNKTLNNFEQQKQ